MRKPQIGAILLREKTWSVCSKARCRCRKDPPARPVLILWITSFVPGSHFANALGVVSSRSRSLQTEQEKLIASLTALVADENLRAKQQRRCSRCGAVMQHIDATFWLYESDSGWSGASAASFREHEQARAIVWLASRRRTQPPLWSTTHAATAYCSGFCSNVFLHSSEQK